MLTACNVGTQISVPAMGFKEMSGSQISLRRCAHAEETGFKKLVLWNMKLLWQEI